MNKILCSAISAVCACAFLAGCANPFAKKEEEDTTMSGYSYDANTTEKEQAYKWLLEPSIDADNIITFDASQVDPDNEKSAMCENYSVIRRGGKYGLIDYGGNIIVQPNYDDYYACWCGEIVLFNVVDEKNDYYEYCTLDSSNQIVDYVSDHTDNAPEYFWNDAESQIYVKHKNEDYGSKYTGKKAVVVGEADISEAGGDSYEITPKESTLYGLAKNDELIIELKYADYYAPAYKGAGKTAIAFRNSEGKWGYVGSDGKTIVDFICGGDLNAYCGEVIDDLEKVHPYLFSADFVPVLVDSFYGYYSIEGERSVTPGEFEQARPVHNGRAWVRSNGLWGVIQLGEYVEPIVTTTTTTTTSTTTTTTSASSVSTTESSLTELTTSPTETTLSTSDTLLPDTGTEIPVEPTEPDVPVEPQPDVPVEPVVPDVPQQEVPAE
ncbi:MAG: WG repeat-containing protein [Ruminococcus sp.]|nr:WG repeat-containing protein [Ruminococcus sp.]